MITVRPWEYKGNHMGLIIMELNYIPPLKPKNCLKPLKQSHTTTEHCNAELFCSREAPVVCDQRGSPLTSLQHHRRPPRTVVIV